MIIDTLNRDTHYFTLDLHNGAILSEPLNFKQYDERSRELAIELTVHNKPLDLTNSRVDIWVYKKDGHTVVKAVDKANTDVDNSIVVIPLTRQMLILPPSVECEIVVTYADKRVLSFPIFEVTIERSNVDMDTIVSTSEFQLFYDALYRMEQWMRDYLDKYATIDQAFTTKLAALTLAVNTVNAEWEQLKRTLTQDNQTNFNAFKQEQTAEMKKFYNQYHKFYTEQCVAIQEKLNTLQADIEYLEAETNRVLKLSQDNANIIIALREQCQTLHEQITQIKADADAKLAEMTRRFTEMNEEFAEAQADRATKFTQAQEARQIAFDTAQGERATAFTNAQNQRAEAFTTEQTNRATAFATEQTNRNNQFIADQNSRVEAFNIAQASRAEAFTNAQTQRTNDFNSWLSNRQIDYTTAEGERNQAYLEAEQDRIDDFNAAQTLRTNTFNENETSRQNTFETNEATRQANENTRIQNEQDRVNAETTREETFVQAEVRRNAGEVERRANEEERKANETQRVEEFNDMKEQFNTFLQYRYIEE